LRIHGLNKMTFRKRRLLFQFLRYFAKIEFFGLTLYFFVTFISSYLYTVCVYIQGVSKLRYDLPVDVFKSEPPFFIAFMDSTYISGHFSCSILYVDIQLFSKKLKKTTTVHIGLFGSFNFYCNAIFIVNSTFNNKYPKKPINQSVLSKIERNL